MSVPTKTSSHPEVLEGNASDFLLLKLFPNLTQYSFNAEKVMDVILQLAVQGKLTASWRAGHPELVSGSYSAKSLLEKIKLEKDKLITEKKIRKEEIKPIKGNESPYDLPNGWEWSKIGEVVNVIGGSQPPKGKFIYENREGYTRLVQIRDFKSENHKVYVPDEFASRPFKEDDIMIGRYGPPVFQILRGLSGTYNVALMKAKPISEESLNRDFLFLLLQEPRIQKIIIDDSERTAGQSGIRKPLLYNIILGFPPLEEQKEIVRIVDQLKAEVDSLNRLSKERQDKKHQFVTSALHHLTDPGDVQHWNLLHNHFTDTLDELENVKKLRETILQLAVQGKLTSKWRTRHPELVSGSNSAQALLEKIKAEKEKLVTEKMIKWDKAIEPSEKHFLIPRDWEWVRLGEICQLKNGYAFGSQYFTNNPAKYVLTTPGNFYEQGGFRDRENKRKYYDGPVKADFILNTGDLLIPMTEQAAGLLGSPAFIPDDGLNYLHNQRLAKMSFDSSIVLSEFSFLFFQSSYFKNELARTCTGMKVRHTSPDRILQVLFPICTTAEQKQIITQTNTLLELCDQLESHITTRNTKAEQLIKAVVGEVLEGEKEETLRYAQSDKLGMAAEEGGEYASNL